MQPQNSIVLFQGTRGLAPNITGSSDDVGAVKQPAVRGRFTKEQICYARATPLQQQRRDHIDEIEYGLMQHPLALYPHLEESMPPDVFEDVVDILDPEMNMASDEENDDYLEDEETESQGTPQARAPPSQQKAPLEEEKTTAKPECVFSNVLQVFLGGQ